MVWRVFVMVGFEYEADLQGGWKGRVLIRAGGGGGEGEDMGDMLMMVVDFVWVIYSEEDARFRLSLAR